MSRNLKIILLCSLAAALGLAGVYSALSRAERAREEQFDWSSLARVASVKSLSAAVALVDSRLAGHPGDSLLYYYKARLYYEAGFAREALAEADRAISLGYAQEMSHLLKALVYGRLYGDHAREKELASKAMSYDPTYDEAYLARAEANYFLGDYRACAKDAAAYARLAPKDAAGYETGLLCLERTGDFSGAEKAGLKVLELKPKSHSARWRLGRLDAARGRHEQAVKKFSEAIRLSGGRLPYYLDRARSCAAVKDFSCSAWDYASAMGWKEVSGYASYYYLLGSAMYRAGELEEALDAAAAAVKREPANPDYYELRGRVLADSGKGAAAKKDFRKMSVLAPARKAEAELLLRQLEKE
ncbi:MAG TPA: tetratricopeptide repeat protein [Elusimicrobiales bacterium]|nr:tetratricopeptide repeat protein [Elusimicrobiales bacterium]